MISDLWFKNAVIYCLHVGTYMDGNGDGVGDFVEFSHGAEQRGIRVIIDLVVNHTSDEHPWFRSGSPEACAVARAIRDSRPGAAGRGGLGRGEGAGRGDAAARAAGPARPLVGAPTGPAGQR